jgi:hypothetical protein
MHRSSEISHSGDMYSYFYIYRVLSHRRSILYLCLRLKDARSIFSQVTVFGNMPTTVKFLADKYPSPKSGILHSVYRRGT